MLTIPFHADAVQAPDYSKSENWAALPSKDDMADRIPEGGNLKNEEDSAEADVFFIHPTSYLKATGRPLGLIINFNVTRLQDGVKRVIYS